MDYKTKLKYAIKSSYLFERFYRFSKAKRNNANLKCIYDKKIVNTYCKTLDAVTISINKEKPLQYWIDENLYFCHFNNVLGNMPIDYSIVVDNSLNDLLDRISHCPNTYGLRSDEEKFILSIEMYMDRIIEEIVKINDFSDKSDDLSNLVKCFQDMKNKPAETLRDALQRILFWNSIFWQTGHKLVGLGRLDLVLDRFNDEALENPKEAELLIESFLCELHRYYTYKSSTLKGDIGQIIVVGGLDEEGNYLKNFFTESFITTCAKLHLPDPKCLIRSGKDMPFEMMDLALSSLLTGIGGPVLANDDVIIPSLLKLGYSKKQAHNYAFSACWEPLSYGDSFGQNNFSNINFCRCVNDSIFSSFEIETWEEYLYKFYNELEKKIEEICNAANGKQWEIDPLFSLFTDGCLTSGKDISAGGAINNDFGILSVGFSNAINSLMNIKKIVFDEKQYTMQQIAEIIKSNYDSVDGKILYKKLKSENSYFGHQDESVIQLCNDILNFVGNKLKLKTNVLGGKFKFGLSSPAYIDEGTLTEATLDGRKSGKPFNTHISVLDEKVGCTELINFASKLDYSNSVANGNVVDIILNPQLVENNLEKYNILFRTAIKMGIYELQINVLSSKQLIDAKEHPEKHPELIVRVWGFSAYFNDLPTEYQDLLINRALANEKIA